MTNAGKHYLVAWVFIYDDSAFFFNQYFNKNNRLKIEGPNVVVFVINKTLAVTSHKMETVKSNTPARIDTLFHNL